MLWDNLFSPKSEWEQELPHAVPGLRRIQVMGLFFMVYDGISKLRKLGIIIIIIIPKK